MIELFCQKIYIPPIFTFLVSLALMPIILAFAKKYNLVVRPNKRTSHNGNIPNIGGLTIFLAIFPISIIMLVSGYIPLPLFIGLSFIFIIGLIDDILIMSAIWKIIGETVGAFCLIYFADIRVTSLYGIWGIYELNIYASYFISYCIYMIIINAINLIDGVDGLASGLGILYSLCFVVWMYLVQYYCIASFGTAIIGTLFVFFLYNVFGKSKKKIFMGDSGALMLGYILSYFVFVFLSRNRELNATSALYFPQAPATAIFMLFVPIFDVFRVAVTRLKHGESIFKADRNHIHHLLLLISGSHKMVTATILSISFVFILIGLILKRYDFWVQLSIAILLGILLMLIIFYLVDKSKKKH